MDPIERSIQSARGSPGFHSTGGHRQFRPLRETLAGHGTPNVMTGSFSALGVMKGSFVALDVMMGSFLALGVV
jgi:hypothetical protein